MYILGVKTSYLAWNWAADFRTGFVFTVSLTVFEISLSDWVDFWGSGQCKNWRQFWVKAKMLPREPFKIQTKQKLFWNQHLNHKLVIWFLNFFNILQILAKIQTLDEKVVQNEAAIQITSLYIQGKRDCGTSYRQILNLNIPLSLSFQAALYYSSHN